MREVRKMPRLDGKVAIITGAGSGMGRAAAILFAKEGAKVVVADWVTEGGEETVKKIKQVGGEAIFIKTDVSKTEDIKKMIKTAVDTYGRLDVLYNNAGIAGELGPITDCTEDNWDKVQAINLRGLWLAMKYAIPEMLKTGGGSIVNTASLAANRAVPNAPAYTASKGGVVSLSRATAIEWATKNIRVNCINPGRITTPMVLAMGPEINKIFLSAIPQGRFGEPEEVAQAALFLASDESSHITGQTLAVDGGMEADSHATG
jgi:NAD(P)-dependent dehydrogenase (short-subunit alcohol dehydrogenase family)